MAIDGAIYEGRTPEEAIEKAKAELGLSIDGIDVEILDKGSKGVFGVGARQAVVRVRRKATTPVDLFDLVREELVGSYGGDMRPRVAAINEDGAIGIADGRIYYRTPRGNGRYPMLQVAAHVRAKIKGKPIDAPRILFPNDTVELSVENEEPECNIEVQIIRDFMEASVRVLRRPGVRYELVDQPPATSLQVVARPVEEVAAPEIREEDVRRALADAGVTYGILDGAIQEAIRRTDGIAVLVAKGDRPPPDALDREDLFDIRKVKSVEPGEVLATLQPPVLGTRGRDVMNREIEPHSPKEGKLKAGNGTETVEDGSHVVATRGGRPSVQRGVISVQPVYIVQEDVKAHSGHIRFHGDVWIGGSVTEGVQVVAGQRVTVTGRAEGAIIRAEEQVVVGGIAIRSRLEAGGLAIFYGEVLGQFRQLVTGLTELYGAVSQLKDHPRFRSSDLERGGEGQLIKLLLELKYVPITHAVRQLGSRLQSAPDGVDTHVLEVYSQLNRNLIGLGPLEIHEVQVLLELANRMETLLQDLEALVTYRGSVVVGAANNAVLRASGKVTITGTECYNTTIWAGSSFTAHHAVVWASTITVVEGDVTVKELGSRGGSGTWVNILQKGVIHVGRVHSDVTISIGGERHRFLEPMYGVDVRLGDNHKLQVRGLKA